MRRSLVLTRETLGALDDDQLATVAGGAPLPTLDTPCHTVPIAQCVSVGFGQTCAQTA